MNDHAKPDQGWPAGMPPAERAPRENAVRLRRPTPSKRLEPMAERCRIIGAETLNASGLGIVDPCDAFVLRK